MFPVSNGQTIVIGGRPYHLSPITFFFNLKFSFFYIVCASKIRKCEKNSKKFIFHNTSESASNIFYIFSRMQFSRKYFIFFVSRKHYLSSKNWMYYHCVTNTPIPFFFLFFYGINNWNNRIIFIFFHTPYH